MREQTERQKSYISHHCTGKAHLTAAVPPCQNEKAKETGAKHQQHRKPKEMKITAKDTKKDVEVSVDFDFGDNLEEVVSKFGDKAAFKSAVAGLKVQFRGWLLAQFVGGKSAETIQSELNANGWTPSERKARATKLDKLRNFMNSMPPEELVAFLKEQQKRLAAAAKAA